MLMMRSPCLQSSLRSADTSGTDAPLRAVNARTRRITAGISSVARQSAGVFRLDQNFPVSPAGSSGCFRQGTVGLAVNTVLLV